MIWRSKMGITRDQYEQALRDSQAQLTKEITEANEAHLSRITEIDSEWAASDYNKAGK